MTGLDKTQAEKKAFVYILECSDSSLYTGWTFDLTKRVKLHNTGKGAKYTRTRLPAKLVYFEEYMDSSSAKKREIEIKKLQRKEKQALIFGFNSNE